MKVLVVGGTGYLGQFLVERLAEDGDGEGAGHEVAFTYHTAGSGVVDGLVGPRARAFRVDLGSGDGLEAVGDGFGEPDAVINCAAVSQPRLCEEKPELAREVNVPSQLVRWLRRRFDGRPLLLHLSTDHIYGGGRAWSKESDVEDDGGDARAGGAGTSCSGNEPVNEYGRLKKEAEAFIRGNYANHAIFRSSIIYGKPRNVARTLFLQWMDSALGSGERVDFFCDEYRCPIYVMDIVNVMKLAVGGLRDGLIQKEGGQRVFNLGGPERLSRYDMAAALCRHRGHAPALAAAVERPAHIKAPLDASMDITRLRNTFTGFEPTPFSKALVAIFDDD